MPKEAPQRLVRVAAGMPQLDLEQRTVRSTIATRLLARDGGIVVPDGIDTKHFEKNPVVLAAHGQVVIGRSLGLTRNAAGVESVTQFAETDAGREYGYLYGLNAKREVFMRAWSFGWRTLAMERWPLDRARAWLGKDWDDAAAAGIDSVWVATQSEMHEYSAVAVGADREALSRAFGDGVASAGREIAAIDLSEAEAALREIRISQEAVGARIATLEQSIQALRRDGSAAAAKGDSAELLEAARALLACVRNG